MRKVGTDHFFGFLGNRRCGIIGGVPSRGRAVAFITVFVSLLLAACDPGEPLRATDAPGLESPHAAAPQVQPEPDDDRDLFLMGYLPAGLAHWQTTSSRHDGHPGSEREIVTQSYRDNVAAQRAFAKDVPAAKEGTVSPPVSAAELTVVSMVGQLEEEGLRRELATKPQARSVRLRGDRAGYLYSPTEQVTAIAWVERPGFMVTVSGYGLGEGDLLKVAEGLVERPSS